MCSLPLDVKYYNHRPVTLDGYEQITCRFVELMNIFSQDNDGIVFGDIDIRLDCRFIKSVGYFCGCNDGVFPYWGADTLAKQQIVQWTQRTIALFSFFGSLAIIIRILRSKESTQSRTYFKIMFALSCSDILSSIAWGLGSLPTTYDFKSLYQSDSEIFGEKEEAVRFYGSHGNYATCKIQGVLLHLGFISIFYNVALSYFYELSFVDAFKESQFNWYYKALLIYAPAVLGIIIALASIPFITFTPVGCTIGSYKDDGGWAKMILLFYLPYGPAFLFIPLNTIYAYRRILKCNTCR